MQAKAERLDRTQDQRTALCAVNPLPQHDPETNTLPLTPDHFVERDGQLFAGTHLLVDLWGCNGLDSLAQMDGALRRAVKTSGATLLHLHLHHFTPNDGISGVAVLAESHISVHTWPERAFAAFDIFMCGTAQPEKAIPILEEIFTPTRTEIHEHRRGLIKPATAPTSDFG